MHETKREEHHRENRQTDGARDYGRFFWGGGLVGKEKQSQQKKNKQQNKNILLFFLFSFSEPKNHTADHPLSMLKR